MYILLNYIIVIILHSTIVFLAQRCLENDNNGQLLSNLAGCPVGIQYTRLLEY